MKKKNFTIIAGILLILSFTNSISAQVRDFRSTNWGMSIDAVKSLETNKITTEEPGMLVYECSLANITGTLVYNFSMRNELMGANYLLKPEYTNMNFYIRDFKLFEDLLTQKYGIAISVTNNATNAQAITEGEWPNYLSNGDLRLERKFDTDKAQIILTLSKIDNKPTIQIDYVSKKFNNLDIQEKSNQLLKSL